MKTSQLSAVESLQHEAMSCSACFTPGSGLQRPVIDLPQPRWIGNAYYASHPRVLVVMLNPGQGDESQLEKNLHLKSILHCYKEDRAGFSAVLEYQREHMQLWGRPQGRFLPFYTSALGLSLDALAFMNIAMCATKENRYPSSMLSRCFALHTAAIAAALQPDVVLLSGSRTHSFAPAFASRLQAARIFPMLHYAHREGAEVERQEHARVRELLASVHGKPA